MRCLKMCRYVNIYLYGQEEKKHFYSFIDVPDFNLKIVSLLKKGEFCYNPRCEELGVNVVCKDIKEALEITDKILEVFKND